MALPVEVCHNEVLYDDELDFANEMEELDRLDRYVYEYLLFRGLSQSADLMQKELHDGVPDEGNEERKNRENIVQMNRIMEALTSADYPQIVTLWDEYVTQHLHGQVIFDNLTAVVGCK